MTKAGLLRPIFIGVFALGGWTAGAALTAGAASACNATPGTTCVPDPIIVSSSSSLVASISGTLTGINPNPPHDTRFTASYTENVYKNPSNSECGGCLTWVIEITNSPNSRDALSQITVSDFAGFNTDIGVTNSAPGMTAPSSPRMPLAVGRSTNGSVLRWTFDAIGAASQDIGPGQSSALLAVDTNSSRFQPGSISAQDGATDTQPGLAPQVPETPFVAGFGLLGGVAGGWYLFRRRRQRTANA